MPGKVAGEDQGKGLEASVLKTQQNEGRACRRVQVGEDFAVTGFT